MIDKHINRSFCLLSNRAILWPQPTSATASWRPSVISLPRPALFELSRYFQPLPGRR